VKSKHAKLPKIRILVADDHVIVRDGIVSNLKPERDLEVIAQAADGVETVGLTKKYVPDIVLLDLRMPRLDGLDVIARIQSLRLPTKVIVLTTFEDEHDVHVALRAGARGYLLKDTPRPMLLEAIRQVHSGKTCIPPRIGQKLVDNMSHTALSARELDILKLVAEGQSNKAIGDGLGIAEGTVKTHVKSVLNKLNAPSRTAAVNVAVHRGLVKLA
jgi:two-component system NarL family response regulator